MEGGKGEEKFVCLAHRSTTDSQMGGRRAAGEGRRSESSLETDQEAADGQLAAAACCPVRRKTNGRISVREKEKKAWKNKKKEKRRNRFTAMQWATVADCGLPG